nr:hypothetical protein [Kofleriaceae bacterium]
MEAADAEAERARLAQTSIQAALATVSASLLRRPNFHATLYGFNPNVRLYFALDKDLLKDAQVAVAAIIRRCLESSDDNMVAVFIDTIIVKRVDEIRECNVHYREFVPPDQAWSFVSEIPELG